MTTRRKGKSKTTAGIDPVKTYKKIVKKNLKKPEVLTKHHRRPISLGGLDRPFNISRIPDKIHKAWTIVAGNMNAEQICNHINTYFKPKKVTLICKFINGVRCEKTGEAGSTHPEKMSVAWHVLFERNSHFTEKIDFINSTLLDPSYHFYIRE